MALDAGSHSRRSRYVSDGISQSVRATSMGSITYIAGAITSGLREIWLAEASGVRPTILRARHQHQVQVDVVVPNTRDLRQHACAARASRPDELIIDPTGFEFDGWTQSDYLALCLTVIQKVATAVMVTPGWEFSRGATAEVEYAIVIGRDVLTPDGTALSRHHVKRSRSEAQEYLISRGWDPAAARSYLSPAR